MCNLPWVPDPGEDPVLSLVYKITNFVQGFFRIF